MTSLLTPLIAPYGYEAQNLDMGATAPSLQHWLGTDIFGRDMLTRIMYGGRVSLMVGFIATAVALVIGILWGATAGFFGGRLDAIMMRIVDVLYALPFIINYGVETMEEYPWLLIFPGLALSLTLFALNFLGDGLRDALDPRTSKD